MLKSSRYILILISIVSMSIVFPKLYWLVMEKPEGHTIFFYSIMENEFVLSQRENGKTDYQTAGGKKLSRKEYFQSLPFLYFRNLVTDGTMPDSIEGIAMDPHEINMTNFNAKLFPYDIDKPDYGLYPLFESNNGINSPTLPDDFFRFTSHSIEFITAENNALNPEKSEKFTKELNNHYFTYPPKIVAGNTSLRKSVDDGYFIVDALDHLFNLKMVDGEPKVTVIRLPKDFKIKHIECVELRSQEFLAIVLSQENKLYLLMSVGYLLEELPIENFHPKVDLLRMQGDMFHKTISISGPSYTKVTVINNDYELVDYIDEYWTEPKSSFKGRLARTLFPFQINTSGSKQGLKRLKMTEPYFLVIFVNILFSLLYFLTVRKRIAKIGSHKLYVRLDVLLILFFGLFAFLACMALKPSADA